MQHRGRWKGRTGRKSKGPIPRYAAYGYPGWRPLPAARSHRHALVRRPERTRPDLALADAPASPVSPTARAIPRSVSSPLGLREHWYLRRLFETRRHESSLRRCLCRRFAADNERRACFTVAVGVRGPRRGIARSTLCRPYVGLERPEFGKNRLKFGPPGKHLFPHRRQGTIAMLV